MNQIKAIQLGVMALCMATASLSSAQTFRVRTSGGNQTITTTPAVPRLSGSSAAPIRAPQIGINPGSAMNIRVGPYIGAHPATNVGVQPGISNQAVGIGGGATGKAGASGNSTVTAQTGINAATGTNTKANTNGGGQTGTTAAERTGVNNIQAQFFLGSTQLPIFATPPPSPTPLPSPTPIPSPSVGPTPTQ